MRPHFTTAKGVKEEEGAGGEEGDVGGKEEEEGGGGEELEGMTAPLRTKPTEIRTSTADSSLLSC